MSDVKNKAGADYPEGVTLAEHIAHDMRMGRFPKQSTIKQFLAEKQKAESAEGLLPCPFCGPGQSHVDLWHDDVSHRWRVGCGRCGASTGISPRDKTQAPAIEAWNRRASQPEQPALAAVGWQVLNEDGEWVTEDADMIGRRRAQGQQVRQIYTAPQPSPDVAALQAENERLAKESSLHLREAGAHFAKSCELAAKAEASEALVADMRDQLVWPKTMDPEVWASLLKRVDAALLSRLDTEEPS